MGPYSFNQDAGVLFPFPLPKTEGWSDVPAGSFGAEGLGGFSVFFPRKACPRSFLISRRAASHILKAVEARSGRCSIGGGNGTHPEIQGVNQKHQLRRIGVGGVCEIFEGNNSLWGVTNRVTIGNESISLMGQKKGREKSAEKKVFMWR